ncbi:MAG: SRPBCC family protein [Burkholderiales bacterium]|nr:SRPBCC family protein [Burkholderiales bacterium]
MDIDKTLTLPAPPARVWALLLDPKAMGECVPGMQSIEVVSDTEYRSVMAVKIAFVSAKFRIRTTVVEQRAPHYLKSEGVGEDASVASSFKQVSEMFLEEQSDGGTVLTMKVKVDVLGRLGTFGLNVMKTKADRMWEEFGANLVARLAPAAAVAPVAEPPVGAQGPAAPVTAAPAPAGTQVPAAALPAAARQIEARAGWLARLFGTAPAGLVRQPGDIAIEVRRGDATITVLWPEKSAPECAAWLREYLRA